MEAEVPGYVSAEGAMGVTKPRYEKANNVTVVTKMEEPPVKGELAPRPSPPGLSVDRRQTTGWESNPLQGHGTTRGRPKKHKTNAERQAAYRERSRG